MNRQIRKLAIALIVLYLALFVQLNVLQVGKKQALDSHPLNNRQTIRDFNRPRGPIVTADGVVVAQSVPAISDSHYKFQREYPLNDLFSNVTGYYTYSFGSTQLEKTKDAVLMGDTAAQKVNGVFGGSDNSGKVVLTMRADLQKVAADALGQREGSIIVMDPHTGAILAMVSYPRYDANLVATHDAKQAEDVLNFLNNYPGKPLLANAYQESYMPGSSFKIITTGIAFENKVISMDRTFPVTTAWTPPQATTPIHNYGGHACGGTMNEVFFRSCNIPFAQIATELGPDRMVAGTRAWGIGQKLPIDLPGAAASNFENANGQPIDFAHNMPLLAIGGFGQANDLMVPLQMCMVASTVADGGQMMTPYVVDATVDHSGKVLSRTQPSVWKTPISQATAMTLTSMMIDVVNKGTGRPMQLANGIQAAAKTGTAQLNATGPQRSHAWIVSFAPATAPKYAVAVVLKGTNAAISAGTGGLLAGPVAKQILDWLFAHP
ncbi:MAG: penicillin-binding protein 2 [Actinomycetota bacterium]